MNGRFVAVGVVHNGQTPPEIVELAAVLLDDGVPAEPVTWLVRPERPIASHITRGYAVSNAEVARAGRFADVHGEVISVLQGRTLVAHRGAELHQLLRAQVPGYHAEHVVDTLELARRAWPSGYRGQSHSLGALASRLEISVSGRVDRADWQAQVTARIWLAGTERVRTSAERRCRRPRTRAGC